MTISTEEKRRTIGQITIAKEEIIIPVDYSEPYMSIYFSVPKDAKKVGVRSSYKREDSFPWIYLSIFDPNNFRGTQARYIKNGIMNYDLWVSQSDSSFGCIPGEIPEGKWHIQFDINHLKGPEKVSYEIYYETNIAEKNKLTPYFDKRIINEKPGWYKGELHSHTKESDGASTVDELIDNAYSSKLDFLSITDHFTVSQWWRIEESKLPDIAIINSLEITSHNGHANIHGIKEWVDVFVDRDDWNVNQAAEETHRQGGLFCINHAMNSAFGWTHYDFDWNNADLFEIYHSHEGPSNIPQISIWDALLREGYRIIGVGGTDLHNPEKELDKLGRVVTWVYTNELSTDGILKGLRDGNVYISFEPKMEFSIVNAKGTVANMGGQIQSDNQPVKLSVSVESNQPLRISIIKNGFFLHSMVFEPEKGKKQLLEYIDKEPSHGYYRVEFHEIITNSTFRGIEWRDFKTIQALGNPIWID